MTDNRRTFMDDYREGHATADQIDDHIDAWHDGPWDPFSAPGLHEWLGLTLEEYACWVETSRLPEAKETQR